METKATSAKNIGGVSELGAQMESQPRTADLKPEMGQLTSLAAPIPLRAPLLFLPAPGSVDGMQRLTSAVPSSFQHAALHQLLPILPPFWPGHQAHPSMDRFRTGRGEAQFLDSQGGLDRGGGIWDPKGLGPPGGRASDAVRGGSPTPEMLVEHADALLSLGQNRAASEQVPTITCELLHESVGTI